MSPKKRSINSARSEHKQEVWAAQRTKLVDDESVEVSGRIGHVVHHAFKSAFLRPNAIIFYYFFFAASPRRMGLLNLTIRCPLGCDKQFYDRD